MADMDFNTIESKLDIMSAQACNDANMSARDASDIRQEVSGTRAAIFNRIGESERYASQNKDALSAEHSILGASIADAKFGIHDNVVKLGTDVAKGFGNTDRAILAGSMDIDRTLTNMARDAAACCCEIRTEGLKNTNHLERQIERCERWNERELRDFRAEQALAFAAVAKAQAECCCETKLLIKDVACEASKEASANFTATTAQISALSREMEKSFCALNTKDLERDLADKQAALVKLQGELSNKAQTEALIAALGKSHH
jgi:hypothetical protein